MKAAYALHEIVLKNDRMSPGSIITDLSEDAFNELEALGAIREATADEVAISGKPVAVEPTASEDAKPAKPKTKAELKAEAKAEAEAKAAAKAAEEAAAAEAAAKAAEEAAGKTDGDPDVTKPDESGDDLLSNT